MVDGEIVAFDGAQTSFERLQGRIGLHDPDAARATGIPVFLYLFDLLVLDGHDITALPLRDRKRLLRDAVDLRRPAADEHPPQHRGRGLPPRGLPPRLGGPGGQAGRRALPARTPLDDWLKLKCVHEQELVVGGWTDPQRSRTGFGALLVGYYRRGGRACATRARSAPASTTARWPTSAPASATSPPTAPPFAEPVHEKGAHWLRPELVAQIGFSEWTRDGKLRHPRYLGLRDDKAPRDVVREE